MFLLKISDYFLFLLIPVFIFAVQGDTSSHPGFFLRSHTKADHQRKLPALSAHTAGYPEDSYRYTVHMRRQITADNGTHRVQSFSASGAATHCFLCLQSVSCLLSLQGTSAIHTVLPEDCLRKAPPHNFSHNIHRCRGSLPQMLQGAGAASISPVPLSLFPE